MCRTYLEGAYLYAYLIIIRRWLEEVLEMLRSLEDDYEMFITSLQD